MLELRIIVLDSSYGNSVVGLTISGTGWGYSWGPGWDDTGISGSGGGGSGFIGSAFATGGRITNVEIMEGGSGYTSAPTLTVEEGGSSPSTASVITPTMGRPYYVSDIPHIGAKMGAESGSVYYYGFLKNPPDLTIGVTEGAYIETQSGSLSLINKPYDTDHPFGGDNFKTLLTDRSTNNPRAIIEIKDFTKYPLFKGTLFLEEITDSELKFSVQPISYSTNLLQTKTIYYKSSDAGSTAQFTTTDVLPTSHGEIVGMGDLKPANNSTSTPAYWNPELDSGESISIYQRSADVTDTGSTDDDYIYADNSIAPALRNTRVWGTSINGTTLEDVIYSWVYGVPPVSPATATTLRVLNYNNGKAGGADSLDIDYYQTEQITIIDYASKILDSCNYLFWITVPSDGSTYGGEAVFLIDKAHAPTATVLSNADVLSAGLKLGAPFQAVEGKWNVIMAFYDVTEDVFYETVPMSVRSENLDSGKVKTVDLPMQSFADVSRAQAICDAIKNIEKKPKASIKVKGVQTSYTPGDRFTINREQNQVKMTLTAREINWNWSDESTTISGECDLAQYEES